MHLSTIDVKMLMMMTDEFGSSGRIYAASLGMEDVLFPR